MILIKAKLLRTQIEDKTFDGKTTRHYYLHCQKTDLDGSLMPVLVSTKSLDASKLLEAHLSDSEFHLIPVSNVRVNAYSLNAQVTCTLDDLIVMHPHFKNLDTSLMM